MITGIVPFVAPRLRLATVRSRWAALVLLLFVIAGSALAELNDIPTSSAALRMNPFPTLNAGNEYETASSSMGYSVDTLVGVMQPVDSAPNFTFANASSWFSQTAGTVHLDTHGDPHGAAFIVWPPTQNGAIERDYWMAQWDGPASVWGLEGDYYGVTVGNPCCITGNAIAVTDNHMYDQFINSNTIFFTIGCTSSDWEVAGGVKTYLGPTGETTSGDSDSQNFWIEMGEGESVEDAESQMSSIMHRTGAGNMTLGPYLGSVSIGGGSGNSCSLIRGSEETEFIWVLNHTRTVGVVETVFGGVAVTEEPNFDNDFTQMKLKVRAIAETGIEFLNVRVKSASDLIIPQRIQTYTLCPAPFEKTSTINCPSCGEIVDAHTDDFRVSAGHASWTVYEERNTAGYWIQGRKPGDDTWVDLPAFAGPGTGKRLLRVPDSDWSAFRLVEQTTAGEILPHATVSLGGANNLSNEGVSRSPRLLRARLDRALEALSRSRLEAQSGQASPSSAVRQSKTPGITDCVVYSPPEWTDAINTYYADPKRIRFGKSVEVRSIENFPSTQVERRNAIRADILAEAATGVEFFVVVGDANEWAEYPGSSPDDLAQPEKDIIPTYPIVDTYGMITNGRSHYYTDQEYGDLDGDGRSDVVIARWPFSDLTDVLSYMLKVLQYSLNDDHSDEIYDVMYMLGDIDEFVNSAVAAEYTYDTVLSYIPTNGSNVYTQRRSTLPGMNDPDQRNLDTAGLWNTSKPELVVISSSLSTRYAPGWFMVSFSGQNPWSETLLNTGHSPVVVAATCLSANFQQSEHETYAAYAHERLLRSPDRGATVWIGSTSGTFQRGNHKIATYLTQEMFSSQDRAMGRSWLYAVQRAFADMVDNDPGGWATVNSYVYLGDPLLTLNHRSQSIEVPDDAIPDLPFSLTLESVHPNPFNPNTTIELRSPDNRTITIQVIDARGRIIRLLPAELVPGPNLVQWNGRDSNGKPVASGAYFFSIRGGNQAPLRAVLLK